MNVFQKLALSALTRYQNSGGGIENFRVDCNFHPSCSEYAKRAIELHGVVRGTGMTVSRLRRCNARDQVCKISDPVTSE